MSGQQAGFHHPYSGTVRYLSGVASKRCITTWRSQHPGNDSARTTMKPSGPADAAAPPTESIEPKPTKSLESFATAAPGLPSGLNRRAKVSNPENPDPLLQLTR